MRNDKVVIVRFPRDEYEQLRRVASTEVREPSQHITYLVRQDLAARSAAFNKEAGNASER